MKNFPVTNDLNAVVLPSSEEFYVMQKMLGNGLFTKVSLFQGILPFEIIYIL